MARLNTWLPLHVGDYLADTMHLAGPAHGAYLLLLMHYWRSGPLPQDDASLAAIARTDRKAWDKGIGAQVRAFFFTGDDNLLHQKRMDAERDKTLEISGKRAKAAGAKWEQERSKGNANADANADHLDTHAGARQLQSQKQKKEEALPSVGTPAAPPSTQGVPLMDARGALWAEGIPRLMRLTGKPMASCRPLMGKMLAHAKDDCATLALVLAEAEAKRVLDPVAWVKKAIAMRLGVPSDGEPQQFFDPAEWAKGPPSLRQPQADTPKPPPHAGPTLDGTAEEVPE